MGSFQRNQGALPFASPPSLFPQKQRQIAALGETASFVHRAFSPLLKTMGNFQRSQGTLPSTTLPSFCPEKAAADRGAGRGYPLLLAASLSLFPQKATAAPCFPANPAAAPGPHIAAAASPPRERLRSAAFLPHFYRLFAQIFLFYLCDFPCQTTEQQYNKTCLQRGELPQRRLACETSKPALFQRAGCF